LIKNWNAIKKKCHPLGGIFSIMFAKT